MKTAAILSTGEELVTGSILDTNSSYISRYLLDLGIETVFMGVCGDSKEIIVSSMTTCFSNFGVDLIIMTGGLGPTEDDLSRESIAEFLAVALVENNRAKQWFSDYLKKMNKKIGDVSNSNKKQFLVPNGCEPIKNEFGTACGIKASTKNGLIISLPGVPREMKALLRTQVFDLLKKESYTSFVSYKKIITVVNLSESRLGELLSHYFQMSGFKIGITAQTGYIFVSLSCRDLENLEKMWSEVLECLNGFVLCEIGLTPAEKLVEICIKNNIKLGCVESCTGGLIASSIISVAGASKIFETGLVTYSNESKEAFSRVDPKLLFKYGAVSEEVAKGMVEGLGEYSKLDLVISTTGIAGPGGGSNEKPVGLVCIGLKFGQTLLSKKNIFRGDRSEIRERASSYSLIWAIQEIKNSLR